MRRRVLSVAVALPLVVLLLPSCVPRTSFNVGVTPSPFGTVRFLFVHCEDQGVTGVSLAVAHPAAPAPRPLWRIRTAAPSPAAMFTVGRTPVGFRESVPLTRALPPQRELFAQVDTTVGTYALAFRALDLVPGLVQRPVDSVTKEAFAAGACG
jgi:hypothetical protein